MSGGGDCRTAPATPGLLIIGIKLLRILEGTKTIQIIFRKLGYIRKERRGKKNRRTFIEVYEQKKK